ncbi:MAG TPA: hypothetical protein VFJ22_20335 [Dermatophilaceae bacterium]|nr:hypothetical protein [Dermatophilaceae bacterium]
MSVLAVFLLALGVADLARAERRLPTRRHAVIAAGVGVAVLVVVGALAGLGGRGDVVLLVLAGLVLVAWVLVSDLAMHTGRWGLAALGGLAVGVGAMLAFSGYATPAGGSLESWQHWTGFPVLAGKPTDRILLVAGLFMIQFATGNIVVRLVLASVGAIKPLGQPQASDRLKGGRLLGPMERVFIVGLGLAGEFTAAGIVIAAKGLIRWPELQARSQESGGVGIDEITEYFLVGSFVSWLVALASLGLVTAT